MLSNCAPFQVLMIKVREKYNASVTVRSHVFGPGGEELGYSTITGMDVHLVELSSGRNLEKRGTDVGEVIRAFQKEVPEKPISRLDISVSVAEQVYTESVVCVPMNPELVATAIKRMLRQALREN